VKWQFTVALTGDFLDDSGAVKYRDVGLSLLEAQPHIQWRGFGEHRQIMGADQIADAQAVLVMSPKVHAESLAGAENLLLLARFGVGYDQVDVPACTAAGVLVTITKGAVDYSVAEATIGWMIALGHQARAKDHLVRAGQWHERSKFMGRELRDRTLGVIGLGGIARKTIELLRAFGMKTPLAMDHSGTATNEARLVSLEELLRQSDYVSIHCPLTEKTRGMIGAKELALMKPEAFLINTARGGIVDEAALFEALQSRRIAGAAIDCFAGEPLAGPPRLAELDNVLLAPHAIAWTDEQFRSMGRMACQAIVDFSLGRRPRVAVNPEVYDRPDFQAKWRRAISGGLRDTSIPAHPPA
jgi:phosphoglycerate dehydrogenase-like enzyme